MAALKAASLINLILVVGLPSDCKSIVLLKLTSKIQVRDIIRLSLTGRYDLQVIDINRSYRSRGNEVRTKIKSLAKATVLILNDMGHHEKEGKKIRLVSIAMNRMFMYSAIKISANSGPPYSVLNPDTSSLSPSARSYGERLVSARVVLNQINMRIGRISQTFNSFEIDDKVDSFRLFTIISPVIIINAILTSYEIVCATLRRAPISEYLAFDAQPAIIIG